MKRVLWSSALVTVFAAVGTGVLVGQDNACSFTVPGEVFCDDFEDGAFSDDSPVRWDLVNNHVATRIEDGSLIIDGKGFPFAMPRRGDMPANGWLTGDVSIRTQARLIDGVGIDLGARRNPPAAEPYVYMSGAESPDEPAAFIGILSTGYIHLADAPIELDFSRDLVLQFDVIGNRLDFWVWQAGSELPVEPLVTAYDDSLTEGRLWIAVGSEDADAGQQLPAVAAFRYVRVATKSIPMSDQNLPGDYNGDGVLDAEDLDLQANGIATQDLTFDLNDDGVVDYDGDRLTWLHELRKTYSGDANLDSQFDTQDFVEILTAGKYETEQEAGWEEGDWNGDLYFDTGDLVVALGDGGYEKGPYSEATHAVPEPVSAWLLLLGVTCFLHHCRR